MIIGDSVLLGEFLLGAEVLDVFDVNAKFVEFIFDEDFVFYERHEF